jgi:hypothetical protein
MSDAGVLKRPPVRVSVVKMFDGSGGGVRGKTDKLSEARRSYNRRPFASDIRCASDKRPRPPAAICIAVVARIWHHGATMRRIALVTLILLGSLAAPLAASAQSGSWKERAGVALALAAKSRDSLRSGLRHSWPLGEVSAEVVLRARADVEEALGHAQTLKDEGPPLAAIAMSRLAGAQRLLTAFVAEEPSRRHASALPGRALVKEAADSLEVARFSLDRFVEKGEPRGRTGN